MQQCTQKCFKNYDTNDGFRHSVWKFHVINCDEVLKKLLYFNGGGRGMEFVVSWGGN
jgi:hypothetical protein